MDVERIVSVFKKFGLGECEARAYVSLVLLGPSKAKVVSIEAKVPQPKIYDVLADLINKELVEVYNGRPKEYKAVAPEVALKGLRSIKETEFKTMEEGIKEVVQVLSTKKDNVIEGVWSSKGKKWIEFFDRASEMLDRSQKYVYAITRDFSRSARLTESAKRCLKRGVKIRVIGLEKINENNYLKAKLYDSAGIELRCFETKLHPRVVLADGKEVLLRLDHDPTKREKFGFNSVWSQDASLVKVMDNYMKNLWSRAEPVNFNSLPFKKKRISA